MAIAIDDNRLLNNLSSHQLVIYQAISYYCQELLDRSPRFKYFTLHGSQHTSGLLSIINILMKCGLELTRDESFYLSLSICMHDIGMVSQLNSELGDKDIIEKGFTDYANLELYIRKNHHELIKNFIYENSSPMTSIGLAPSDIAIINEISKNHRVTDLSKETGLAKRLGALLRLIDELDIGPQRTPPGILENFYKELDPASCWHWYKHTITQSWMLEDNVNHIVNNGKKTILFSLIVRPNSASSVQYWLKQIFRSINRVLLDEHVQTIIEDEWNITIDVKSDNKRSKAIDLGPKWREIESIAISSGLKSILVIDDESRKMEDLFYVLQDRYKIIYSPNASDALTKLKATHIDLAIVDMQIGSGGLWKIDETNDHKTTGIKICKYIMQNFPSTKIGVLTGTRHPIIGLNTQDLAFFLRKPIDPDYFDKKVSDVLS